MRIVQITDIHVGLEGEDTRGVDTRYNFISAVRSIAGERADLIVLTGDVCYKEPRLEICEWVRDRFSELSIQPIVIPGNHDTAEIISSAFEMPLVNQAEVYFSRNLTAGTTGLFLDTSKAEMSDTQWAWLEQHFSIPGKQYILFMHHPPISANVPYMDDNHSFRQQDRFLEISKTASSSLHVFCGHYHICKSVSLDKLHVHIAPSTFFQIRDDIRGFGVEHHRIGYRIMDIGNSGEILHRVKWL